GSIVLRGDEPEPVTVTLQPLATVTGRVLGNNGQPLAGHRVEYDTGRAVYLPDQRRRFDHQPIVTDHGGRFRMDDVPPGMPIGITVLTPKDRFIVAHQDGIVLKPKEQRNLGDLRSSTNAGEP
ncbi:MAG TPA: hypothetical protein VFA18_25765, partial [Gemmataceae bacterium]|nr:hypothetical protein [Gemmataceae bacterium]